MQRNTQKQCRQRQGRGLLPPESWWGGSIWSCTNPEPTGRSLPHELIFSGHFSSWAIVLRNYYWSSQHSSGSLDLPEGQQMQCPLAVLLLWGENLCSTDAETETEMQTQTDTDTERCRNKAAVFNHHIQDRDTAISPTLEKVLQQFHEGESLVQCSSVP